MKPKLDWQKKEIVNIFDEASLWAASFGQILLEHIPMKAGATVLDIGFGNGYPLIELAQRFGNQSKIYGIDLWAEAINRTREKIRVFDLENITIFEQSAEKIPLDDNSVDLITSNLGVNNFENKEQVIKEIHRVLKTDGSLCITTNPIGTFEELFEIFSKVIEEMEIEVSNQFEDYVNHRGTKESIIKEFQSFDFQPVTIIEDKTNIRFLSGEALFDHGLMRIGFLESWEKMIPQKLHAALFSKVMNSIDEIVKKEGQFIVSIPILYFEF